jgi:plastocyanin
LPLLIVVVVAAVVFAACGSDDRSDTPSEPTSAQSGGMGGTMHDMGGMDHHDRMAGDDEAAPVAEGAREVEVAARSFQFEPSEIRAEAGEDLAVVLTSEDVLHDFTIDELDAHVAAEADETETGGVRAAESGRYAFYCSVPGHRSAGMEGTLVVE